MLWELSRIKSTAFWGCRGTVGGCRVGPSSPLSLGLNWRWALTRGYSGLAEAVGLMAATPSDASTDEMIAGDIATAKAFGERIKAVAERWAA